jgi:hypothetical protein
MISKSPLFDTRQAAHVRISPLKQAVYCRIMEFAHERGAAGFTCDEIVVAWGCSHNSVCPRLSELQKSGKLIPSKFTRPARTESPARVLDPRDGVDADGSEPPMKKDTRIRPVASPGIFPPRRRMPRDRALRQLKLGLLMLAGTGIRSDFLFGKQIFDRLPELKTA